jgi:excisionase family DNA binding protein
VEWVRQPEGARPKVAYSEAAVELFDRAALIAKSSGDSGVGVGHVLAAFAGEEGGLMGELRRVHGITSASWRAAVASLDVEETSAAKADRTKRSSLRARDYLTPEEAAETLSVHVQAIRAYIRSGRLPAYRLAGERALRIRHADLEKVLEPL